MTGPAGPVADGRSRPLWWSGLRSRPLINLLLLMLASVAVATAVLGPLLTRSVQQAAVQQVLGAAGPGKSSIAVSADVPSQRKVDELVARYTGERGRLTDLLTAAVVETGSTAFQPPDVSIASTSNVGWRAGSIGATSRVNAVSPDCDHLVLTVGRCPAAAGEVLVSSDDARRDPVSVGSELRTSGPEVDLRVVGWYDPAASDRGQLVRRGSLPGALARVSADPLVVTDEQAAEMLLGVTVAGRLLPGPVVRLDDEAGLRATVAAVQERALEQEQIPLVDTELPDLLDRAELQQTSATALIAVIMIQALLLAVLAVSVVLHRLARTRAPEWGIGRLRGLGRWRWLCYVYTEPAVVLVVALPFGYLLGVLTANAAVATHLAAGTPVEPWRWPVWTAAVATAAVALVSMVGVSLRTIRRPLSEVLQQASEPRGLTPLAAVGQTAVILLAATTGYDLLAGGLLGAGGGQLGLLAPAVFALAVAVIAVRAAVVIVRRVTARPPRSLAALVVGRSGARRPSSLNPAVVIAVGLALAVFAGQVLALSLRNQDLRATAVVGADQVLQVEVPAGVDLREAVERSDPSGTHALAAQERSDTSTGGSGRIIAVDSRRLMAVTAMKPEWIGGADTIASLRPSTVAPLLLRGTTLSVSLTSVDVTAGLINESGDFTPNTSRKPPTLQLVLDDGTRWQRIGLGELRPDADGRLSLRHSIPCAKSCRVVSLGLASEVGTPYRAELTVAALSTDQVPASANQAWLHEDGRWSARVGQNVRIPITQQAYPPAASSGGLKLRFEDDRGGSPTLIGPTDVTDPLPAIAGPRVDLAPFAEGSDVVSGTGLDGESQLVTVVGRAIVLPRVLDDGVLVDLDNARGLSDPAYGETVDEVWLSADAPSSIESALLAQGVRVQTRERLSDERTALHQESTTRAATVSLWLAVAAVLLSLLCLVSARVADVGRRRRDWRSLAAAGVTRRLLRRLVLIEVALPSLLGCLVGMVSGGVALVLAVRQLPLIDLTLPGPPLALHLAVVPLLLATAVVAIAVLLVAGGAAVLEIRRRM